MADIQASGPAQSRLPLYTPQGRPQIRTKNRFRPDWLDRLKRPLQIVAFSERQFEVFRNRWRFDFTECRHVQLVNDIRLMPISIPILVLPGAFDASPTLIEDFCPVRWWKSIGGVTIDIPERVFEKPFEFTVEDNMAASTLIAIAQHRHLDNLNRK